ncbi:MAG: hemerythrin domain-containing protein [Candidatus Thermoplasmatota archaeon]
MNKSVNILPIMIRDHKKIESLLDKFEENVDKGYEVMNDSFKAFEWRLEKHLFVEEKVIFTKYQPENISEDYKMLPELTKQHNYLINELKKMRKDIKEKNTPSGFYEFKRYLEKHRNFEEENVYPKLDKSLTTKQKSEMIEKMNEII